ncbi:hypothetical protein ACFLS0_07310 [Candidatus Bipolaricaulota bacterium]
MADDDRLIAKPFLPTLIDTVDLTRQAVEFPSRKGGIPVARAAILHCALAIEALANNMLQFLDVGRHLGESLDRLDVMAKFELFALLLKRPRLDRGSTALQVLSDFIALRNGYVHPKITIHGVEKSGLSLDFVGGRAYNSLGLTKRQSDWGPSDSSKCTQKLLFAVDHLLLDQLQMEEKSLSCMLCDDLSIDGLGGPMQPSSDWAMWAESALGHRVRFFMDHIMKRFEV